MLRILHVGNSVVTLSGDVSIDGAATMADARARLSRQSFDMVVVDCEVAAAAIRDCGVPVLVAAAPKRARRKLGESAFESLKPFISCAEHVSRGSVPPFVVA